MSERHLIPMNQRSPEVALMLQKRGGYAKSKEKNEGQKLRQIKARLQRGNYSEEDKKWLLERLEDRPAFAAEVLITLDTIKKDLEKFGPIAKVAVGNYEVKAMEVIHGAKIKTENVNVNINTTIEEWEKRLYENED